MKRSTVSCALFFAVALVLTCAALWTCGESFDKFHSPTHHAGAGEAYLRRYLSVSTRFGTYALMPGSTVRRVGSPDAGIWAINDGQAGFKIPATALTDDVELGQMLRAQNAKTPRALAEESRRRQIDQLTSVAANQEEARHKIETSRIAKVAAIPASLTPAARPTSLAMLARPGKGTIDGTSITAAKAHLAR